MPSDYTWPKPYLIRCYEQAVEHGCIRIVLRGATEAERFAEWKSFKAAFYRLRRKKDANFAVQMRPEFQMVSLQYEAELGKVLIVYSSLPDDQGLPAFEAVDDAHPLPRQEAPPTLESNVEEDFDPTEHVAALIDNIDLEGEDEDGTAHHNLD